jgi:hypothetical protein
LASLTLNGIAKTANAGKAAPAAEAAR